MKNSVKTRLEEAGYEDVLVFESPAYETAFVGVTSDNRAVYDKTKMAEYLVEHDGMSYEEAVEFIEFNSDIQSPPYPVLVERISDDD